jgi:peroxidase
MAKNSASITCFYSLLLVSSILFASYFHASEAQAPVVKGLAYNFFAQTCPNLENIVRNHLTKVLKSDNGQAPGLLRIFFHDCFVQVYITQ